MKKQKKYIYFTLMFISLWVVFGVINVYGAPNDGGISFPNFNVSVDSPDSPQEYVDNIKLLILFTVLTLLPSFIIMTTCFTRVIVVLSLFKNAVGAQQAIPKQVLIGLALFLTFFIMAPTYKQVNDNAVQPYLAGEVTQQEAIAIGEKPLKQFMLKQTNVKDLNLFLEIGNYQETVEKIKGEDGTVKASYDKVPFYVVVPAFMISELKTAFQIGFLLFIPFLIVDIVTGSILMSMGMMMVPPVMVALPFKLLLFVMVDGWYLLIKALILSFR